MYPDISVTNLCKFRHNWSSKLQANTERKNPSWITILCAFPDARRKASWRSLSQILILGCLFLENYFTLKKMFITWHFGILQLNALSLTSGWNYSRNHCHNQRRGRRFAPPSNKEQNWCRSIFSLLAETNFSTFDRRLSCQRAVPCSCSFLNVLQIVQN